MSCNRVRIPPQSPVRPVGGGAAWLSTFSLPMPVFATVAVVWADAAVLSRSTPITSVTDGNLARGTWPRDCNAEIWPMSGNAVFCAMLLLGAIRQRISDDVIAYFGAERAMASRCGNDILFAVDRVAHRRRLPPRGQPILPQLRSRRDVIGADEII